MTTNQLRFCLAEYCASEFYTGWWLYERETNDGKPNSGPWHEAWGWMESTDSTNSWSPQQKLNDLCRRMGHEPPPVERYSQKFAEWFAGTFPNGLRVRVVKTDERHAYDLIEIPKSRPRQRRGVIRTLRGAARAAECFSTQAAAEAAGGK